MTFPAKLSSKDLCPLCGGEKAPDKTTVTFDFERQVIVVRQVPAQVCQQCGEIWISHEIAKRLQHLLQEARKTLRTSDQEPTAVELVDFREAA